MTDAFFAQLDLAWLSARLDNRAVEGISFDGADLDKLNKTSGLRWAQVTLADGGRVPLVFKVSTTTPLAILLGLAREALFYCSWAQLPTAAGAECALGGVLPRVYHAEGCMATGEKVLVMEDLSAAGAVQLGHVFGGAGAWPGNPNNWGKDVAALTRGLPPGLGEAAATRLAFGAAATLHAPFWGCAALAAKPWLRGAGWIAGADREAWEQAQSHTREQWAQVKSRLGTASYTVNWDPRLVACIDAALAKVNARWAGLGFYRRARMLHEGSQQVVREHGGKLPETVEGLMRLRGIGRYTAGAIASVCFGVPAPIVDGNVLRVLSRLCGVACSPKDGPFASDSGLAWTLAERLVCAGGGERPGDLNQAIMELGATLCAPGGSGVDPRDPLRAYYASTAIGRDVYAALMSGELAGLLEPTTAPNAAPATTPVTAAHGLFACPVCRHGAEKVLSRLQSLAAQPLPAAAPAVAANPFALAADPRGLAAAARAAAALGTLPAALADAEAGAALVHSWLPLPAAKKAKREERLAVAAIYHDCAASLAGGCTAEGEGGTGRRWLLVRRPEGGLLGGQWEFPHAIVASAPDELPDDPGGMFRRKAVDAVLEGAGVFPAALSPRAPLLRTLEHIFSHVRHTIHVEHACLLEPLLPVGAAALASDEPFESGGRTYCWMHAQRMAAVGVTSGVQKVLAAVEESLRGEGAGSSAALKQKPSKKDANGPTAGAGGAGQGKRKGGGGGADEKTQPKMSKFFSKS